MLGSASLQIPKEDFMCQEVCLDWEGGLTVGLGLSEKEEPLEEFPFLTPVTF